MSNLKKNLRKLKNVSLAVSAVAVSGSALAVDHTTALTAAQTDATGNVTLAVQIVIGLLAIVTGIGVIKSLLGK